MHMPINRFRHMTARACIYFVLTMLLMPLGTALADVAPSGWDYVYADGWIYYGAPPYPKGDAEKALLRYRPEDGTREVLAKGGSEFYQLCVMDGWVYTPMYEEEGVLRVRIDGGGSEVFVREINTSQIFGVDGQVFSWNVDPRTIQNRLSRYDAQTGAPIGSVVLSINTRADFAGDPLFVDGWVYYAVADAELRNEHRNFGHRFLRVRQDGSETQEWFVPDSPLRVTMWTIADGRLYYCLVDSEQGTSQLRSVGLDATGDTLINSESVYWWFAHDGYAYGSPLEWDKKFKNYYDAEQPTVRLKLSGGALETVGDFHPSVLRPAGEYLVCAGVYGKTKNHPVLIWPDGSEAKQLPLD